MRGNGTLLDQMADDIFTNGLGRLSHQLLTRKLTVVPHNAGSPGYDNSRETQGFCKTHYGLQSFPKAVLLLKK